MTGSYAQYRTLKADRVTIVDAGLDDCEATTLVLSWMIAYQLLHRDARAKMGQTLLVIGAAGAVGQALAARSSHVSLNALVSTPLLMHTSASNAEASKERSCSFPTSEPLPRRLALLFPRTTCRMLPIVLPDWDALPWRATRSPAA